MNTALIAPFTADEVRKALFDIGDLKAPGPDRLHAVFYKRFWPMLGEDLVAEVLAAINSCKSLRVGTIQFVPSSGLRQGNPLSPYLFLLCSEGLTALLSQAEATGMLAGLQVCRDAPSITNLLFADDSLILMQANSQNALVLQQVLNEYCAASGQAISQAKSSIFFSPNTNDQVKQDVCARLNITTEALTEKYLGLPTTVRANAPGMMEVNRTWDRLWKLNVPNKVKIFNWRALHGVLPLRCILANRHVKVSAQCPICQGGAEDIKHLLFLCPRAKEIWSHLGLNEAVRQACEFDCSGQNVLEFLLEELHHRTWLPLLLLPPGICGGSVAKASVVRLCKS